MPCCGEISTHPYTSLQGREGVSRHLSNLKAPRIENVIPDLFRDPVQCSLKVISTPSRGDRGLLSSTNQMATLIFIFLVHISNAQSFDILIRNGTIYDGSGTPSFRADVGINQDTVAVIGDLKNATGKTEIDATGLYVTPGFINMLSWADGAFLKDGRSMSDIKQGVTLEVFGEGISAGPRKRKPSDKRWTTLGGYFETLEKKGVSPNFASFVGATTVRDYVLGHANRAPNPAELQQMRDLVEQAMKQGAMGLGSSLIYAPADYASTGELIELCKVVSKYSGIYITHMRSESDKIFAALNETFRIAKEANVPAEIYHLKINHERNWNKIDTVLYKIDSAQKAGLKITANLYTYKASGTGLMARLPNWVQEGGMAEMRKRLKNPAIRQRVLFEMRTGIPQKNSDPKDVLIMGFRKDSLDLLYRDKRLDEVARLHGKDADETAIDLLVADRSAIPCMYFLISENNLKRMLQLPYVSFCSDAASAAAEEPFILDKTHPRVYGSFARLLGKYVRDEKLITMEEAIRRLTSLPASNLQIAKRGLLKPGNFADVAIFDPQKIQDKATYEEPHQYAEGMIYVLVNGTVVLQHGEHTGAMPGRCVRGPGWKK
jgi:N-acyl-D-amino-acid deacylase